ncbi:hypothetical protein P389DRAFT_193993 [Cystobasidium minutum MCA 4210]|uniref:uncharacterized protein n=1 Tax=Cystobasidium minutum MCA 4210 TaxID=1397322 RepID=UPI0034CE54E7|eukprot:jgi/Rhomi1/193993/gm1.2207_g
MDDLLDPYKALGLENTATLQEAQAAYERLSTEAAHSGSGQSRWLLQVYNCAIAMLRRTLAPARQSANNARQASAPHEGVPAASGSGSNVRQAARAESNRPPPAIIANEADLTAERWLEPNGSDDEEEYDEGPGLAPRLPVGEANRIRLTTLFEQHLRELNETAFCLTPASRKGPVKYISTPVEARVKKEENNSGEEDEEQAPRRNKGKGKAKNQNSTHSVHQGHPRNHARRRRDNEDDDSEGSRKRPISIH